MIKITILTPTYNRASLLPRLYESLKTQTSKNFEWIIVDDGSSDTTKDLVQNWIINETFRIKYIYKENGGKHTAINRGILEATGKLTFIADSDDWLSPTAIEDVETVYDEIKGRNDFGGVCGLDSDEKGQIIGSGLPQDFVDATSIEIREKYKVKGDLKEVFLTSVLKKFPFPEIPDEKFCPEMLIWNRIAREYKLRFFNKSIYIVEYQPEGITASITKARMNSPIATMITYLELSKYEVSKLTFIKSIVNYWRFFFCSKDHSIKMSAFGYLGLIPGFLLHLRDKLYQ